MGSKIILVTGASDGIGKETAMTLAKQGHTIIIHGRNKQKLQAVYDEIKRETGNKNIDMFTADFLSLEEIKRFANTIKTKYDHLDVLINNAGAQFGNKREVTIEGHEKTMMINVFAPFLLTTLLLDLLRKSPCNRFLCLTQNEWETLFGRYRTERQLYHVEGIRFIKTVYYLGNASFCY